MAEYQEGWKMESREWTKSVPRAGARIPKKNVVSIPPGMVSIGLKTMTPIKETHADLFYIGNGKGKGVSIAVVPKNDGDYTLSKRTKDTHAAWICCKRMLSDIKAESGRYDVEIGKVQGEKAYIITVFPQSERS